MKCVTLRCVTLRCIALRCVALHCVALRWVAFRGFDISAGYRQHPPLDHRFVCLTGVRQQKRFPSTVMEVIGSPVLATNRRPLIFAFVPPFMFLSLPVVHRPSSIVHRPSFIVHRPLFTIVIARRRSMGRCETCRLLTNSYPSPTVVLRLSTSSSRSDSVPL